jgi:uncharacterized OB-fold protein
MREATMSMPVNDTLNVLRPDIAPYTFSMPYWEASREKRLLVQYCRDTGQYQFYPRPTSIFTGKRNLEWREVSAKGVLFSYTIGRRPADIFRGHEPYCVAAVTLDVGVNIVGNLIHCDIEAIKIGMSVGPYWHPIANGMHLLMFEPASKKNA